MRVRFPLGVLYFIKDFFVIYYSFVKAGLFLFYACFFLGFGVIWAYQKGGVRRMLGLMPLNNKNESVTRNETDKSDGKRYSWQHGH